MGIHGSRIKAEDRGEWKRIVQAVKACNRSLQKDDNGDFLKTIAPR